MQTLTTRMHDKQTQTIQMLPLLHGNIDVQAEHLLLVLIEHLALDAVHTGGGLVVEDGLLDDRHLTSGGRAGQTVNVDLSAVQRQVDGRVLAKVALLGEHLQTLEVSRKSPGSRSEVLIQHTVAEHGGVLAGDDGVVNDLHGVEDAVSLLTGADLPGDGAGREIIILPLIVKCSIITKLILIILVMMFLLL